MLLCRVEDRDVLFREPERRWLERCHGPYVMPHALRVKRGLRLPARRVLVRRIQRGHDVGERGVQLSDLSPHREPPGAAESAYALSRCLNPPSSSTKPRNRDGAARLGCSSLQWKAESLPLSQSWSFSMKRQTPSWPNSAASNRASSAPHVREGAHGVVTAGALMSLPQRRLRSPSTFVARYLVRPWLTFAASSRNSPRWSTTVAPEQRGRHGRRARFLIRLAPSASCMSSAPWDAGRGLQWMSLRVRRRFTLGAARIQMCQPTGCRLQCVAT